MEEDESNCEVDLNASRQSDGVSSMNDPVPNLAKQDSDDSCDETPARSKHRIRRFADSDSENGGNEVNNSVLSDNDAKSPVTLAEMDSDDSSDTNIFSKSGLQKSRIRKMSSSGSDCGKDVSKHEASSNLAFNKYEEQKSRIKTKKNKLRQKFESLVTSRGKEMEATNVSDKQIEAELNDNRDGDCSDTADEEAASIEIIKQKIKERTMHLKTAICDPDTSDEESSPPKEIQKHKQSRKSTKLTSPKPMRMSAKEAMENMQKIRSESNRMLREKEVSLPYHRPKALSLKDIMSRRRPAVTPDGKALPIKMNEEQLKQYVILLEQRQKEMIELCKSDTDEDTADNDKPEDMVSEISSNSHALYDDLVKNKPDEKHCNVTTNSDELYDDLVKANTEDNKPDTCLYSTNSTHNSIDENPEIKISAEVDCDKILKEYPSTAENVLTCCDLIDLSKDLSPEKATAADVNDINSKALKNATSGNTSTEMKLVYDDNYSIENTSTAFDISEAAVHEKAEDMTDSKMNQVSIPQNPLKDKSESDSEIISLHYDSEKIEEITEKTGQNDEFENSELTAIVEEKAQINEDKNSDFSDDDINMEDIDNLIENAEIIRINGNGDNVESPMLIREQQHLRTKPKLLGTPGMVIDLDGTDPFAPKKLTGVELLKERFKYFSKFKTTEEMEREREKIIKPGTQHLKLKQALEEEMTEQRSLEWTKRLEEAKLQQTEMDAIRGDASDAEDEIEKIKATVKENDEEKILKESSSASEEEEEEFICVTKEKPRLKNPMISDEAEESDCDEFEDGEANEDDNGKEVDDNGNEADAESDANDDESVEESSEEESESEGEQQSKPKTGRILKAFEDSDEESTPANLDNHDMIENIVNGTTSKDPVSNNLTTAKNSEHPAVKDTQDDEIQLAQLHKSLSDDIFASQDSASVVSAAKAKDINTSADDKDLGTQTFSILNSEVSRLNHVEVDMHLPDKLTIVCDTQPYDDNLDAVVGMCSGSFSQNLVTSQFTSTETQSQAIGEDVLALCTGKFYDNQFVSQIDNGNMINDVSQQDTADKTTLQGDMDVNNYDNNGKVTPNDGGEINIDDTYNDINQNPKLNDGISEKPVDTPQLSDKDQAESSNKTVENILLRSILDELNDPAIDSPKQYKYFASSDNENKVNKPPVANGQMKKRFVIDSDDEGNEKNEDMVKKKKFKKKKLGKRALLISDDEDDDQFEEEEVEDYTSEKEDDNERLVEYDSEENEVEVNAHHPKKKRKTLDFFEQEAELTSEDEWVGSGDEDEAGLDRMEHEAGDDDTFNQGQLRRELGQIHMREVMDQDKREVRLIQELLFEDGDLGGGGRQRKFRWMNADGEDATGTIPDELADTQEEEFESEEQWRKQRHERYTFLKEMEKHDNPEESANVSVNRTSIIKANLCSRTMSSLLEEGNVTEETVDSPAPEKKTTKDVPSPKKPFALFQQTCHGSLLARGHGALARLAALASPIAGEDDSPKVGSLAPSSKRNFVFATLTPEQPKITKRKADENAGTPKLVKKLKTEEKQKYRKGGLMDHLKA